MNIQKRLIELEKRVDLLELKTDDPLGIILYRTNDDGSESYQIRKEGKESWIDKVELDNYLKSTKNRGGVSIFKPEKLKENFTGPVIFLSDCLKQEF